MKKKLFHLLLLISIFSIYGTAQDDSLTLKLEDIQAHAYPFTIENGTFKGAGAEVLTKAIANAHITVLGDNYRSKLESVFTKALISELDRNAYQTMILETGIASGNIIQDLSIEAPQIIPNFQTLNQRYGLGEKERLLAPIPEFKSIEAGAFLSSAVEQDWAVLAIGTDSWTSYKMLTDKLYNNLSATEQQTHQDLYQTSIALLNKHYGTITAQTNESVLTFITALQASKTFQDFLRTMATYDKNVEIVEAIQFSMNHWRMYGNREFYKKNKRQAARNKRLLAATLHQHRFDFKTDKLFLKMWVNHLAKGTTVNGFFGVGNTLHELAEYHGHNTLNIAIARRFYRQEDTVKDIVEASHFEHLSFQELIPLGQKAKWVLIDLRSFNETFYWKGYTMSTAIQKEMMRYDMVIIPMVDESGLVNY